MKGMKIITICHLYIRFWINNKCKVLSKKANELFQTCYAVPYFSLLESAFLGISNTTLLPLEATFFRKFTTFWSSDKPQTQASLHQFTSKTVSC